MSSYISDLYRKLGKENLAQKLEISVRSLEDKGRGYHAFSVDDLYRMHSLNIDIVRIVVEIGKKRQKNREVP